MAAPTQIALVYCVSTVNTIYTPAQAAAKLAAVPLYASAGSDPVLGQAFGLTVASDTVSDSGVTYTDEAGGPFLPGETVTDTPSGGTATVAVDEGGILYFVAGSSSGTFAHGDTITGGTSGATATVNNPAAGAGPSAATLGDTPGAARVLVLNMTGSGSEPFAPPPFPCRPTGPLLPPPGAPPTLPYTLEQTTIDPYTRLPVTTPAPAAVVAFYSTSSLDTDGVATTPVIAPGSGAQIMALTYMDSTGAGPFTTFTKLMGKYPAVVTLAGGSIDVAVVTECLVFQAGAFGNSVGQITLAALPAALPAIPPDATPADFAAITDAAQLTIERPLVYLPPSYYALAQQGASAPQLAGDFSVEKDSPTVLTSVSQLGILVGDNAVLAGTVDVTHGDTGIVFSVPQTLPAGTVLIPAEQPDATYVLADALVAAVDGTLTTPYTGTSAAATKMSTSGSVLEFASQPGVQYTVAAVSATFIKLTTAYTGLARAEIAPAAEAPYPAQSVSEVADRVVTAAMLVAPSQAAPPDSAHLLTPIAEFTLPQSTAPALTYVNEVGGPFTAGETVTGQKSTGTGTVLYDNQGIDDTGVLAFTPSSVKKGFVRGETVTGGTSHATATVVVPRTLATNPLPVKLSGLYARTLTLVLGAPVTPQPVTLL
jgi:hypothetical protein